MMVRLAVIVLLAALAGCTASHDVPTLEAAADREPANQTSSTIDLAGYDAAIGRRFFIQCQACHSLGENEANKTGPNLWGLFGRPAGAHDGFDYSAAFDQADFVWTTELLEQFLIKPSDLVPGTTMIFPGVPNEESRRHLLAYLLQATGN